MINNYLALKKGIEGSWIIINVPGFSTHLFQKTDGTLVGSAYEGQPLENFITAIRASIHSAMLKQGMYGDFHRRIEQCCEIIELIDRLVETHNSKVGVKLEIIKTF